MIMRRILFDETNNSPAVKIDEEKGFLEISGKSTLPDPVDFYSNLLKSILTYKQKSGGLRRMNVHLSYMNTGSSKWMYHIFKQLEKMSSYTETMEVNWYYEEDDEAMAETGKDYMSMLTIPFNMIPERITDN
jgi:hypothetical protein